MSPAFFGRRLLEQNCTFEQLYSQLYIPYSQSLEQLFVCQPVMGTGAGKNSLLAQIIPGKLRLAFQTCYYALTERK